MAIKASGSSLSFSEIRTFWGDANSGTMSLSEYYAGGSNVFSSAVDEAGNSIPSSGTIKVSDFYSTHTVTTGGSTDFTSGGTFNIPLGVSTLTVTLHGGGGQGGEGDESGAGGGGGGGGSGGTVQGTLTVSNNIQGNPSQQTIAVSVGAGGSHPSSGTHDSSGTAYAASGGASSIVYNGQTTSAGGGGYGGGYNGLGQAYSAASQGGNSIGSNFSASINNSGNSADGNQAASGDGGSAAGTSGKALASNPLSLSSSGGAGGAINPNSASVQIGKSASGIGAGGGGAASRDRSNTHHWTGGAGSAGFVRIVVAS